MKFIVDAHLPRGICDLFSSYGPDAVHTRDLPKKNRTKDGVINQISLDQRRVVVTKDSGFFFSHIAQGRPWKLLIVSTGNISRQGMLSLFQRHLPEIIASLEDYSLVELDLAEVRPIST